MSKSKQQLSDLQLDLLGVLWDQGEATVAAVVDALAAKRGLALTTVATLLKRLEKRGLVSHSTSGRQYLYRATVERKAVRGGMLADLRSRSFGGDLPALVNQLIHTDEVAPEDLERIKAMIAEREAELDGDHG